MSAQRVVRAVWGLLKRLFGLKRPEAPRRPSAAKRLPASIVFCDIETTGLRDTDRIVSFAGIGVQTAQLASGVLDLAYSHLVFDPAKKSHPQAE